MKTFVSSLPLLAPNCSGCGLQKCPGPIYGSGHTSSPELMIIGDAPDLRDVQAKQPFSGHSGKYMKEVLSKCGVDMNSVYYTNICACRPPIDRDPTEAEISACRCRLYSEIEAIQPKNILILGTVASKALLGGSINTSKGRLREFCGIRTLASLHPAFVLRFPETAREFSGDVLKLLRPITRSKLLLESGELYVDYEVLSTVHRAVEVLNQLLEKQKLGCDIETSMLDPRTGKFLSHGFKASDTPVYILPHEMMSYKSISLLVSQIYENPQIVKVIHNSTYEWKWINHTYGIRTNNIRDTLILHYCVDERSGDTEGTGGSFHGLKVLGQNILNLPDWSKEIDNPEWKEDYSRIPKDILYKYQALDIAVMSELEEILVAKCESEDTLRAHDLMSGCVPMISAMELLGTRLDIDYLTKVAEEVELSCLQEEDQLSKDVGVPFKVTSPKQVSHILYDVLGLKPIRGKRGTGKKILEELVVKNPDNEYISRIRHARQMRSILSTHIKGLIKLVGVDGRIHTQFMFHGTDTGRLASRRPNLMNVPKRVGPLVRNAFIPTEGFKFAELDYKQLEFRVTAMECLDPKLIEFIQSGRDVHNEVACAYFNCQPHEVSEDMRYAAKAVVFGVIYGRTANSIAEEFHLSLEEATRRQKVLFEMFPAMAEWVKEQIRKGKEDGYVQSIFGRRRRFELISSRNERDVRNQSVNTPIQCTASDICLLAGKRSESWMDPNVARKLIFVHDSILLEAREDVFDEVVQKMIQEMRTAPFDTPVPLDVDVKAGYRWGSLEKYEPPQVAS